MRRHLSPSSLFCTLAIALSLAACSDDAVQNKKNNTTQNNTNNQNNSNNTNNQNNTNNTNNKNNQNNTNNQNNINPWGDDDGDGVLDPFDNCRGLTNTDQADRDTDGVGDLCDNCPDAANGDQADADGNGVGDACEPGQFYDPAKDTDGDGVPEAKDNCAGIANPDQLDTDNDKLGDLCDNCPLEANYDQADADGNGVGDACEPEPAGMICGEQSSQFELVKPNIYLVVDRSTSMNALDGTGVTRMDRAKQGMDLIAKELFDEIRLGISAYPYRDNPDVAQMCGKKTRELLKIGDYTENRIKNSYRTLVWEPGGLNCTETDDALESIIDLGKLDDATDPLNAKRQKAVVLITDGGACGCGGQTATVAAARALKQLNIPVYVVGFSFGGDTSKLNEVAQAGGTDAGMAGNPRYYEASNAQELITVLRDIQSQVIDCSYTLNPAPQDPAKLWVSISGTQVPLDAQNGFSYDGASNTLSLNGQACTSLQALPQMGGQVPLEIKSGCSTMCVPEGEEVCDYKDNDCDGEVDEGCEACVPEICDGKDNDCDGQIDEGCPQCTLSGGTCEASSECCAGICREDKTCGPECRPTGVSCLSNADCCSGTCAKQPGSSTGACISG